VNAHLARLALDPRHAAVRRDLADPVRLHQRVMSLLPDGLGPQARQAAGVLFRQEDNRSGTSLLVQALLPFDFSRLPDGYAEVAVRDLRPMLAALRGGKTVRYRIVANTTKRVWQDDGRHKAGQVVPLAGDDALRWWRRRAEAAGLDLRHADVLALDSARRPPQADSRMRHAMTRFDGVAVIGDPDAVRGAILAGLGKGKSYGCGLLSLAPGPPS